MFRVMRPAWMVILLMAGFSQFFGVRGQVDSTPPEEWTTFQSPSGDFSLAVPTNEYLIDNEDGSYRIYYYSRKLTATVHMTPGRSAKDRFREQVRFMRDKADYRFFESGDFLIRQGVDKTPETPSTWISLASSNGSYSVSVSSRSGESSTYDAFLRSIELDGKPLFVQSSPRLLTSKAIRIDSLKTDPIVLAALRRPDSLQKNLVRLEDPPVGDAKREDKKYSRPFIILRKPRA